MKVGIRKGEGKIRERVRKKYIGKEMESRRKKRKENGGGEREGGRTPSPQSTSTQQGRHSNRPSPIPNPKGASHNHLSEPPVGTPGKRTRQSPPPPSLFAKRLTHVLGGNKRLVRTSFFSPSRKPLKGSMWVHFCHSRRDRSTRDAGQL